MNSFIAVLSVIFIAVNAQIQKESVEVKRVIDACMQEAGGSILIDKFSPKFDARKSKCYFACLAKKMNTMIDGKINVKREIEVITDLMPEINSAMKARIIECCIRANEMTDECEVAAFAYYCIYHKDNFDSLKK